MSVMAEKEVNIYCVLSEISIDLQYQCVHIVIHINARSIFSIDVCHYLVILDTF